MSSTMTGFFAVPAYPRAASLRDRRAPEDTFAGALAGVLASGGQTGFKHIKEAMVAGAAAASMTVESFSSDKLEEAGLGEILRRAECVRKISEI